jgi:hypothetical protein
MEALLIIILLMLLSAVSNWLKKRGQPDETEMWPDETEPRDPRSPSRRPGPPEGGEGRPVTRSWEEELRRLLEGESRPPQREGRPAPVPPPLRPVIVTTHEPAHARPAPSPVADAAGRPSTIQTIGEVALAKMRTHELKRRASEEVARAEKQIGRRLFKPATIARVAGARGNLTSNEIVQARSWFRSPESARQAVIASVILGKPRGLEEPGSPSV